MKLGEIALGARAEGCCADLEVRLERAREGYETFIHAEVTRPAAPEVALAERDASIVAVMSWGSCVGDREEGGEVSYLQPHDGVN